MSASRLHFGVRSRKTRRRLPGARTDVVGNSCNLATESNKPLIHRDNSLKKVNLTFKRGLIVLKLAKNSAVIHLPQDSVLDVET